MKKFLALLLAMAMVFSLAACGEKKEEAGTDEINIAFIGNTTGDYAQYGVPVRNAVAMFFEQVNAAGGINGKQVNLLEYDDKGDGNEAKNAFNLAMTKNISAVVGSVLTGATIALADETYKYGIPQITGSATNPGVTLLDPEDPESEVRTNVFRTCFLDPFQGEKMAEYAKEQGAKNIAVFYETGSDYSEAIVAGLESKLEENGLTVVCKEAFGTGDKDFKSQMTNIAAANPDMVFMPIYYGEAGLAITALRAAACKAPVVGGDGFGSVKNYASAEDLEGTVYFSGYAPGTESVAQFEKDYFGKYNVTEVNMFAPLAWDACLLLTEGLKSAEEKGLKPATEAYWAEVCDVIKNANGFEGITGSYVFNESNDPVKSVAILTVTGGEEVFTKFF